MEFIAKSAKITSSSDKGHWGGAFCENGLFVLLEVETETQTTAAIVGNKILEGLLTRFTDFKERNSATITKLLEETEGRSHISVLIIGLLEGKSLFLGSIGEGMVLLKREGKTGQILSSNEKTNGEIQIGDTLLFFSKKLDQCLTAEKKDQLLSSIDPEETTETLATYLSSSCQIKGIASLAVVITGAKKNIQFLSPINSFREKGREKISKLYLSLKTKIAKGRREEEYMDQQEIKAKRTLLTIAIILVFLLTISIFFNMNNTLNSKKQKQLSESLNLVSHQYDEAVSLIDLNPIRARELLSSSKLSLAPLLREFPKNSSEYRQLDEWLDKLSTSEVAAYKIYKLAAVPLFFDINLIKQGGAGEKVAVFKETQAILDTKNRVVYTLSAKTKQAAIIAGSEVVKDAKTIALHGSTVFLLNSDGVVGIDISSKTAKTVIKTDERWGEIAALDAFAGNLYLLDRKNHTIWKYIATDFGFSDRLTYLNSDVRVNFSNASAMIIDGSVWVLQDNEIVKFTRGLGEPFAFKGFAESLPSIIAFSTSDTDKNLYLLDKTTSRIVVFDKDGAYQSQYQWEELKNASDLTASEEEKKIFVMIGSKIYAIDIK